MFAFILLQLSLRVGNHTCIKVAEQKQNSKMLKFKTTTNKYMFSFYYMLYLEIWNSVIKIKKTKQLDVKKLATCTKHYYKGVIIII